MLSTERSRRKVTGGFYKKAKKKKSANLASIPSFTKVSDKTKVRFKRMRGGQIKPTLLISNKINVFDPSTKKSQVTEIISVIESPSNRNFIRRNIITKGAVVNTKLGKVKVTSRPGQEGAINGLLIH